MKKAIKNTQIAIDAIKSTVNKRRHYYKYKSEKWRFSDNGLKYGTQTFELEMEIISMEKFVTNLECINKNLIGPHK